MSASEASTISSAWLERADDLFSLALSDAPARDESMVGPYRLIAKLGEGGLGEVWRAEQSEPIQREVAIKLIRRGLHHQAEVLSRFNLERQALARMQHPNIAAILDAGTTEEGMPYFVMELVEGLPLTTYAREHALGVRAKLSLFITICHAVHHAHQKGVLHRDLKPSNIMVAHRDGEPQVKVIDFGIAKALDPTDESMQSPLATTRMGELPCATYQYMSPEQASLGTQDIDTRSDIYTLGVILYELLTGSLPLPEKLARSNDFHAIAAHLRDADPPRPSVRATSLPEGPRTSTALRGDLDWIVLRALERDRERRYESAAALALDLQRHLQHEPVSAGPPSAWYRIVKSLRRHRVGFAAAAAVLLSLCIGLGAALISLQREREALTREAAARAEAVVAATRADQAKQVADKARSHAEKLINDMLFDLRDRLEPIGRVSLLDEVSKSAAAYFSDVPASADSDTQQRHRAASLQNRGSVLMTTGDVTGALAMFEASLAIMCDRVKAAPREVARLHDLALAYDHCGRAHEALKAPNKAKHCYEEMGRVVAHLDAKASALDRALAHERLGDLARSQGDLDVAAKHYESGLSAVDRANHPTHWATLQERLASLSEQRRAWDDARARYTRAIEARESDPRVSEDTNREASLAIAQGRLASLPLSSTMDAKAARRLCEVNTTTLQRLVTQDPLNLMWTRAYATALHQLGAACETAGDAAEATRHWQEALRVISRCPLDDQRQRTEAGTLLRLAALAFRQNDAARAHSFASDAIVKLEALPRDAETTAWLATARELLTPGGIENE